MWWFVTLYVKRVHRSSCRENIVNLLAQVAHSFLQSLRPRHCLAAYCATHLANPIAHTLGADTIQAAWVWSCGGSWTCCPRTQRGAASDDDDGQVTPSPTLRAERAALRMQLLGASRWPFRARLSRWATHVHVNCVRLVLLVHVARLGL